MENLKTKKALQERIGKWFLDNRHKLIMVFAIAALVLGFFNLSQQKAASARLNKAISIIKTNVVMNQHERDSLVNELQEQGFKEEFYINQLGIQSEWIIFYVSTLFVIFGFVGFGIFSSQISGLLTEFTKVKEENAINREELHQRFEVLEKDMDVRFDKLSSQVHYTQYVMLVDTSTLFRNSGQIADSKYAMVWACVSGLKYLSIAETSKQNEKMFEICKDFLSQINRHFSVIKDFPTNPDVSYFCNESQFESTLDGLNEIKNYKDDAIRELAVLASVNLKTMKENYDKENMAI